MYRMRLEIFAAIQEGNKYESALKDLLGGTIKEMMEAEMDDHLGYEKSERSDNDDYRNGYKRKQVKTGGQPPALDMPGSNCYI